MTAYGPRREEPFPLSALSPTEVKPELRRQVVDYETRHAAGTVVVDTPERRLYYVMGDGKAMRYGVGVGRAGSGTARPCLCRPQGRMAKLDADRQHDGARPEQPAICRRRARRHQQPARRPARSISTRDGPRTTMFRIHGTNQPQSIGHAMSSGCVRMLQTTT